MLPGNPPIVDVMRGCPTLVGLISPSVLCVSRNTILAGKLFPLFFLKVGCEAMQTRAPAYHLLLMLFCVLSLRISMTIVLLGVLDFPFFLLSPVVCLNFSP